MDISDATLLDRWQRKRDADAFAELVQRHSAMVYASCKRILGEQGLAEDVTQECFVNLMQTRESVRASLGAWLHSIAVRRSIDRLRSDTRRRKREELFADSGNSTTDPDGLHAELLAHVDEAIAELPQTLKSLVIGRFLETRTHADLARELKMPESTVRHRLEKGVERIRESLRQRGVIVAAAAFGAALEQASEAAPLALVARLNKLALSGAVPVVSASWSAVLVAKSVFAALSVALACLVIWRYAFASNATLPALASQPKPALTDETVRGKPQEANTHPQAKQETRVQTARVALASTKIPRTITGTVIDSSAAPVEDALVEWTDVGFGNAVETIDSTRTDAAGRYALTVTKYDEAYRLSATKDGYAPAFMEHSSYNNIHTPDAAKPFVAPPPPATHDFTLEREHAIAGSVIDEQGEPITGARVIALTPAGAPIWTSFSSPDIPLPLPNVGVHDATTDAGGNFRLDGLPAGEVNLKVTAPLRSAESRNYPVDRSCTITMNGSGQPGHILAQVFDGATGQPVQAFIVACRYDPAQRAITNPDGVFEVGDLAFAREYELHVYAHGYLPWNGNVKATKAGEDGASRIELRAGNPLLGQVIDVETHQAVSGASIVYGIMSEARYLTWNELENYIDGVNPLTSVQRATTDSAGNFWFCEDEQTPGGLIVQAPGYARLILRAEDRSASKSNGVLEVPLMREAVVCGTLPENLVRQFPAIVHIQKVVPVVSLDETFENYTCDAAGGFIFQNLAPGRYQVGIQRALGRFSYTTDTLADVTLKAGQNLDISAQIQGHADGDSKLP